MDHYNKKFSDFPLDADAVAMKRKGSVKSTKDDTIIAEAFEAYDDIYVVKRSSSSTLPASNDKISSTSAAASSSNLVRCRNYGCQKMFDPSDNAPGSCTHHVAPPIFHDTKKGWSCCRHKMVYDWKDFETIVGCATGVHSTEDPKVKFAASPTVAIAEKANQRHAQKLKTVEEFNKENPEAATAASSAKKTMDAARTRGPVKDDKGRFKCVHKGCGQYFFSDENTDTSCVYHPGRPIFHDTKKFYSCCDHRVVYDFDEFLKIEGCTSGKHSEIVVS